MNCSSGSIIFVVVVMAVISSNRVTGYRETPYVDSQTNRHNSETKDEEEKRHCDMDVCETIVTKCSQTRRCSCDFKNDIFCAKDCVDCLEEKFGKCCGCVDLCPPSREDTHSSHVGDIPLDKTYNELFEVLTETDDRHGRWTVKYKDNNTVAFKKLNSAHDPKPDSLLDQDLLSASSNSEFYEQKIYSARCTMAFINKQLSMVQCRRHCKSMGATRYRWFDEGCCECLGKYCTGYGIDRPECVIEAFD